MVPSCRALIASCIFSSWVSCEAIEVSEGMIRADMSPDACREAHLPAVLVARKRGGSGLLVSRECSFRLRVCPILAQIDCFKRVPVPSLEEPCSDSRGCQVLAPGESLL